MLKLVQSADFGCTVTAVEHNGVSTRSVGNGGVFGWDTSTFSVGSIRMLNVVERWHSTINITQRQRSYSPALALAPCKERSPLSELPKHPVPVLPPTVPPS